MVLTYCLFPIYLEQFDDLDGCFIYSSENLESITIMNFIFRNMVINNRPCCPTVKFFALKGEGLAFYNFLCLLIIKMKLLMTK